MSILKRKVRRGADKKVTSIASGLLFASTGLWRPSGAIGPGAQTSRPDDAGSVKAVLAPQCFTGRLFLLFAVRAPRPIVLEALHHDPIDRAVHPLSPGLRFNLR
jgi:hypothetical protein